MTRARRDLGVSGVGNSSPVCGDCEIAWSEVAGMGPIVISPSALTGHQISDARCDATSRCYTIPVRHGTF